MTQPDRLTTWRFTLPLHLHQHRQHVTRSKLAFPWSKSRTIHYTTYKSVRGQIHPSFASLGSLRLRVNSLHPESSHPGSRAGVFCTSQCQAGLSLPQFPSPEKGSDAWNAGKALGETQLGTAELCSASVLQSHTVWDCREPSCSSLPLRDADHRSALPAHRSHATERNGKRNLSSL